MTDSWSIIILLEFLKVATGLVNFRELLNFLVLLETMPLILCLKLTRKRNATGTISLVVIIQIIGEGDGRIVNYNSASNCLPLLRFGNAS